ncbi:hypothetical protein AYL99_11974 [Fonsecaea erecta]|uniref:Uncharacterized protein n=1 Tax=Fonsecaea erecta TaxID=1367422 RepID=A0A178Z293_9EURO|nr:hypothetical protein AYL99_11974 [Fonsecaea erecta]OAP53817.1 hypothetical protein AYL99_11974 [Fonsecaea erecta]
MCDHLDATLDQRCYISSEKWDYDGKPSTHEKSTASSSTPSAHNASALQVPMLDFNALNTFPDWEWAAEVPLTGVIELTALCGRRNWLSWTGFFSSIQGWTRGY